MQNILSEWDDQENRGSGAENACFLIVQARYKQILRAEAMLACGLNYEDIFCHRGHRNTLKHSVLFCVFSGKTLKWIKPFHDLSLADV